MLFWRPVEGCAQPGHCDTLTEAGIACIGVPALDVIFAADPILHWRSWHFDWETLPSWANSVADYACVLVFIVHRRQVTGSFNYVFTVEWPKSLVDMWSWAGTVIPPPLKPLSRGLPLSQRHHFPLIDANSLDQNIGHCASCFFLGS